MIINNSSPISKTPSGPDFEKLFQDIQGNILKSHARPHVKLLFINLGTDVKAARKWIADSIMPRITSFEEQLALTVKLKSDRVFTDTGFCSFSLSKKGYDKLQVETSFKEDSFNAGLGSGTVINDPKKDTWEKAYQKEIHGLVILAHTDNGLNDLVNSLKASIPPSISIVAEENGEALPGEKEHFGFADGISQPRFFSEDLDKEPSKNWNSFASLDSVLIRDPFGRVFIGGITGDGDIPVDDFSGSHSYGSFLVYRKLEQDVDGWNKEVVQKAAKLKISPGLFGAYAVGRFQDGTPVVNHGMPTAGTPIENDFDYSSDSNGLKCPFHAHIRKSNPRGDSVKLGATLESEKGRRISRRGIPYQEDEKRKGLLFMCYQSSIVRQFEFMQNSWVDNLNFVNPDTGDDSVIGQNTVTAKSWPLTHGGPSTEKLTFAHFVTLKGGEYFFTPSISGLRSLTANPLPRL